MSNGILKGNNFDRISNQLGLNPLQAKIILSLLEEGGEATAPQIINILSKEQKINRTSVYLALDQLSKLDLVLSTEQPSKHKKYALISTSPEKIIETILRPQKKAILEYSQLLKTAKESQSLDKESFQSYYSLQGRKHLMKQISTVIEESQIYILIQANTNMLDLLYPLISDKVDECPDIEIFIQVTWNPNPNLDMQDIKSKYEKIIGIDHVALPNELYTEIFDLYKQPEYTNEPLLKLFLPRATKTHFGQLLTDVGTVLGLHYGSDDQIGGGSFTRDPFTTHAHHIIFFFIFETSLGKKVDRELLKKILLTRLKLNFELQLKNN
ncbi:MAG: hypothetical protein ACFFCZ_17870 [Promethearchaeota archaeon]